MSCKVTRIQPIGEPYEDAPDPGFGLATRTCVESKDCPRGGLGGTYKMNCRGEITIKQIIIRQNFHICYECIGVDGCVFNFCDTEERQVGTKDVVIKPCNALENCGDCPEYPNRPGDGEFPGGL